MNALEKISQYQNFPVWFHQDFVRAFGKTPQEMNYASMNPEFEKGKIDAEYFAKMLLKWDSRGWLHLANMRPGLENSISHLFNLFEDICAYIANPDFNEEDFDNEFMEISHFFVEKFPKSSFTQEKTSSHIDAVLLRK